MRQLLRSFGLWSFGLRRRSRGRLRRPAARGAVISLGLVAFLVSCNCGRNEQGYHQAPVGGDLLHAPAPRLAFDEAIRQACGAPGASELGEQTFLRFPYLQAVDATGAELVWVAESDLVPTVHLRDPVDGDEQTLTTFADLSAILPQGTQRVASASDLDTNTLYCYELRTDEGTLFSGGLRTAPTAEDSVRFAAMGDLGKGSIDQYAVLEQLQSVDAELLLVTGDLAYEDGTLGQFEEYFFSVYRDYLALVPVFPAAGNHDYNTDDAAPFRQVFRLPGNERWYSLDHGPVHIAVLDTEQSLAEQATWLRDDLAASSASWNVVVLHEPPYSSGHHGSDKGVQRHLVPVFEEMGVDLVLAGHDHHYERTASMDGVVYVITGGGGRGTRDVGSSSFTAYAAQVAHFVYVQADPEQLTLYAIDATGAEFDTLRLTR